MQTYRFKRTSNTTLQIVHFKRVQFIAKNIHEWNCYKTERHKNISKYLIYGSHLCPGF